jgi:hypothetical protein
MGPVPGPQPRPSVSAGVSRGLPFWSCHGDAMAIKAVATPEAREAARRVCAAQADARAAALAPVIAEIRASGVTAPYAIAAALTARGVRTARGHSFWMTGQVRSLLVRLDRLSADGILGSRNGRRASATPASTIMASPEHEP